MPISRRICSLLSTGKSIFTPRASSTSALPQRLEMARLPCLATGIPAAATMKATVVEILKVWAPSPPVPQVSITVGALKLILTAFSRITLAAPVISATVSPFSRNAVKKLPICAGEARPSMIALVAAIIVGTVVGVGWQVANGFDFAGTKIPPIVPGGIQFFGWKVDPIIPGALASLAVFLIIHSIDRARGNLVGDSVVVEYSEISK